MTHFNTSTLDRISYLRGFRKEYQLAQHLGITPGTLRNWRAGRTAPSFAYLSQMFLEDGIPFEDMILEEPDLEMAS